MRRKSLFHWLEIIWYKQFISVILSDDKNFLKWITVLLNKQLREYMQAKEHTGITTALRGLPQYRQSDVDDCLNEMPENQKTVTIMHCLGKLKEKDIANRLKMSEEGVARLLKSGKQKVKNVLDKKWQLWQSVRLPFLLWKFIIKMNFIKNDFNKKIFNKRRRLYVYRKRKRTKSFGKRI